MPHEKQVDRKGLELHFRLLVPCIYRRRCVKLYQELCDGTKNRVSWVLEVRGNSFAEMSKLSPLGRLGFRQE